MTQPAHPDSAGLRTRIRDDLIERLAWFKARYDVVRLFDFRSGSERVYLGEKTRQVCRYCEQTSPAVKFHQLAHAIPDQVGNDWLFDYEECYTCNANFAKRIEDDFGKWTLPWRSLGRIKGKRGVPSFKSNDKKFRIDATVASPPAEADSGAVRHNLKILMGVNDVRHELDEATRTVKLTLDRPAYVPMGVFKCLVKMAIAVMPPEEQQRCAHLKQWILQPAHTFESYPYRPLHILSQFAPGPLPNDRLACFLLRRKPEGVDDCLYMQFVFQFSNHVFQIALPMHIEDRKQLEMGNATTALWPHFYSDVEHQLRYGRTESKAYDMSGVDPVRGDSVVMPFSYGHLIGQPNDAPESNNEANAG